MENEVPNTVLRFLPQKSPYWLNESQKTCFGGSFSPISAVLWGWLCPKTIGFIHVWTLTNHANFMKTVSKLRSVLWLIIIIISWKPRSVIFECKFKNIYEVLLLKSILVRKKILWRINFILIKFLISKLLLEKLQNECKKPSFIHEAISIFPFYIHGFELWKAWQ